MTHLIRLDDLDTVLRLAREVDDIDADERAALDRVAKAHAELVAIDNARTKPEAP